MGYQTKSRLCETSVGKRGECQMRLILAFATLLFTYPSVLAADAAGGAWGAAMSQDTTPAGGAGANLPKFEIGGLVAGNPWEIPQSTSFEKTNVKSTPE